MSESKPYWKRVLSREIRPEPIHRELIHDKMEELRKMHELNKLEASIATWERLNELFWDIKAEMEQYERNPELRRPDDFRSIQSWLNVVAISLECESSARRDKLERKRDLQAARRQAKIERQGPIFFEGGRVDGNSH